MCRICVPNLCRTPNLVSVAQSFLKPEDPMSNKFSSAPAPFFIRCQVGLAKVFPRTEFGVPRSKFPSTEGPLVKKCKLIRFACDLQVWDRWRHPCAPQGREKMVRSKHLHVHCTCTMHPSPLLYTASSRPCQGAPMYRVWCR